MAEIFELEINEYMPLLSVFFDIRYFRLPEVNTSDFEHLSIFDIRYPNSVFSVFGYITNRNIESEHHSSIKFLSIEYTVIFYEFQWLL